MRTLCTALVLYLVAMTVVIVAKPDRVYNHKTRQYRPFGTAAGATLTPIWLVALLAAAGAYAVASIALSHPSVAALLPFVGRSGATTEEVSSSADLPVSTPTLRSAASPPIKTSTSSSYTRALPEAPPLYEFRQPEATDPPARPFESMYDRLHRERQAGVAPYDDDRMYDEDTPAMDPYYDEAPPWPSPEAIYYPPAQAAAPMRAYGGGSKPGRGRTLSGARVPMRGGGRSAHRRSTSASSQGVVQRSRVWRRAR